VTADAVLLSALPSLPTPPSMRGFPSPIETMFLSAPVPELYPVPPWDVAVTHSQPHAAITVILCVLVVWVFLAFR